MDKGTHQDLVYLKPNKPETYGGRRDFLSVNTWMFKVEHYLALYQLNDTNDPIFDENNVCFGSSFFKGSAAIWWYNNVGSGNVRSTWNDFKYTVSQDSLFRDHLKRARDRLRNLKQTKSLAQYLGDFQNIVLTISRMHEDEKMDRFIQGLKHYVRIEMLMSHKESLDEDTRIALNVSSANRGRPTYDTKMETTTTKIAKRLQISGQRTRLSQWRLATLNMKNYLVHNEKKERRIWKKGPVSSAIKLAVDHTTATQRSAVKLLTPVQSEHRVTAPVKMHDQKITNIVCDSTPPT